MSYKDNFPSTSTLITSFHFLTIHMFKPT